jgi:hypothetical protein
MTTASSRINTTATAVAPDRLEPDQSAWAHQSIGDQVIEVDHQPAMAHQLRRLDQLGQFLTRIKHARLHRGLADADYLGNLFDGFAVIVDQVDDLAVLQ